MTTVVNNPAPVKESGGYGFLVGIILIIAFIAALLYFGIPMLNRATSNQNGQAPQINIPAPQIVIPDKINVDINQPK